MDKDDFFVKTQIESNISRVDTLLNTGIFNTPVLFVFRESVFTEIIIRLNDLLQKLNQLGKRISFSDDIEVSKDVEDVKDITDLISKLRNSVCHMESGEHLLDKKRKIRVSFCVAYGKCKAISTNGKEVKSDYEDDICFFFGEHKIYLKRHIVRVLKEAEKKARELYKNDCMR